MNEQLKLCQCGGKAELRHKGNEYTKKRSSIIGCTAFGCTIQQVVSTMHRSLEWCDEKAIEKWNRRPIEDALNKQVTDYQIANELLTAKLAALNAKLTRITIDKRKLANKLQEHVS